jgi:hypothetical protein
VAELAQRAADKVRAQARFHADDAWRQLLEHVGKRPSFDLPTEGNLPVGLETDDVEDVLADIDRRQGLRCVLCLGFDALLLLLFAGTSVCRLTRREGSRSIPLADLEEVKAAGLGQWKGAPGGRPLLLVRTEIFALRERKRGFAR